MTTYLAYATLTEADNRSRAMWESVLGRVKHAEDVTEYLYARQDEGLPDGVVAAIEVPARDAYLDTLLRQDKMTVDEMTVLVDLYPAWAAGVAYSVDDLAAHSGQLYRVVQAHTSQSDWEPPAVPALFTPVAPAGAILEWVQPTGAQDAYALDALVTHNARVWKSLMDGNTWEPGVIGTWRDQSDPPMWIAPSGSIGLWHTGDIVTHVGQVWQSTVNSNTVEPNQPPRARWTAVG